LRLLLDTHAFLWWLAGDDNLSTTSRQAIGNPDNEVFVSAASAWEIATKFRLGKLPGAAAIVADLADAVTEHALTPLPISIRHAQAAGMLPGPHRDPFDRMLMAQAMSEDMALVSNEDIFDAYGVRRLW
jgi:PIN domain nuclease of toxin-antitoxin system